MLIHCVSDTCESGVSVCTLAKQLFWDLRRRKALDQHR